MTLEKLLRMIKIWVIVHRRWEVRITREHEVKRIFYRFISKKTGRAIFDRDQIFLLPPPAQNPAIYDMHHWRVILFCDEHFMINAHERKR